MNKELSETIIDLMTDFILENIPTKNLKNICQPCYVIGNCKKCDSKERIKCFFMQQALMSIQGEKDFKEKIENYDK